MGVGGGRDGGDGVGFNQFCSRETSLISPDAAPNRIKIQECARERERERERRERERERERMEESKSFTVSVFFFLNAVNTEHHIKWLGSKSMIVALLTHCILNRLSHTIYWKDPISILGTFGYEIYIFLEKNGQIIWSALFANYPLRGLQTTNC